MRPGAAALGCMLAFGTAAPPSTAAAPPSTAAAPQHRPCAAGTSSATNARVEADVIGAARQRFERTLPGRSAAARRSAGRLFATDLEAYLYGYPIVMMHRTVQRFPRNLMVSIGARRPDSPSSTSSAPTWRPTRRRDATRARSARSPARASRRAARSRRRPRLRSGR